MTAVEGSDLKSKQRLSKRKHHTGSELTQQVCPVTDTGSLRPSTNTNSKDKVNMGSVAERESCNPSGTGLRRKSESLKYFKDHGGQTGAHEDPGAWLQWNHDAIRLNIRDMLTSKCCINTPKTCCCQHLFKGDVPSDMCHIHVQHMWTHDLCSLVLLLALLGFAGLKLILGWALCLEAEGNRSEEFWLGRERIVTQCGLIRHWWKIKFLGFQSFFWNWNFFCRSSNLN